MNEPIIDKLAASIEALNRRTAIKVIDIVLALPDDQLRKGLKEWKRSLYKALIEGSEPEEPTNARPLDAMLRDAGWAATWADVGSAAENGGKR